MPIVSDELKAFSVRNQVLLERLKAGEHRYFQRYLKRIERSLSQRIRDEGERITTKKQLNKVISDTQIIQKEIYDEYIQQLSGNLGDIALSQAKFEAKSYQRVAIKYELIIPDQQQVISAFMVNPIQVKNYAGDTLLKPFLKDFTAREASRVKGAVRQGFALGQNNSEIIQKIRGTKNNKFLDGILAISDRNARAIIRTAVQHSATQARLSTMAANDELIKGYQWVSTLDSRTTTQCQSLDGMEFKTGEGPLPPIHIGCRSAITPVLSEQFNFLDAGSKRASKGGSGGQQVSSKETYYLWLKKQPSAFQDEAIGPSRAKLLRRGGISADEFARLSLDKNFEPLTLAEMERKAPAVFEQAGIQQQRKTR